jgi:tRNA A-37 threonylcarbamoyl transferase component Bud32
VAVTATEQVRIDSTVAGKYRIQRVLGRGGMGIVYEAETIATKRRVAIKIMHPEHQLNEENVKRFLNEGTNAGRVKHPNVVEFIEMGRDVADGSLFIVLELLRGTDLSTYLVRYGHMQPRDAIVVVAQVLQAIAVAHSEEIVHRDIKPENIFLTRGTQGDAHVKIVDFGISKAINPEKAFMGGITQINTTVGTPHYMSPEQAKGEPIDPRADLWALGVVLYEALTGHLPFDGDNFNTQIVAVVTEAHVPASTYKVDADLSAIVDRCLQKDRTLRFGSAGEMLDALRDYVVRHPEVGLAENALFEQRTQEWRAAAAPSAPTAIRVAGTAKSDSLEPAAVFPGMVSIEEDNGADAAPTQVRALDRSLVRPAAIVQTTTPSATQMVAEEPSTSPNRTGLLAIIAISSALLTGAGTYLLYQRIHPAALSNTIQVRLLDLPPGARIMIDNVPYINTTLVRLPRSGRTIVVGISGENIPPQQIQLSADRDQSLSFAAFASRPPQPPPQPAPVQAPAPVPALQTQDASTVSPAPAPQVAVSVVAIPARTPINVPVVRAPVAPAEPTPNTFLTVGGIRCVVSIDGVQIGPAPVVRRPVASGPHRIGCERNGQVEHLGTNALVGQTTLVRF